MQLNEQALSALRHIGVLLDQGKFPNVRDGGVVVPGKATVSENSGKETKNDTGSRKRRPAARPWKGPARGQRKASGSRSSGAAAPVLGANLRKHFEKEVLAASVAYPTTRVWPQEEGMWMLAESVVLPGLPKKATFLLALPFVQGLNLRAWGFWTTIVSSHWIGPRHTNYPDGSICAFEPRDRTWVVGDQLRGLIDLYSLWALRHLYLEKFQRWPGYQSVPHAYERLEEFRDDEYCGCENSQKLYVDCCKASDLEKRASGVEFVLNNGRRHPPDEVVRFVRERKDPPNLRMFTDLRTRR